MEASKIGMVDSRSLTELLGLDEAPVAVAPLELWPRERRLVAHGQDVHLTGREFELLRVLLLAAGHVISRARLHEAVWGEPLPHPRSRSVDVTVRKVRRRLSEASPGWTYIHTHFGHGYRFEPERSATGRGTQ